MKKVFLSIIACLALMLSQTLTAWAADSASIMEYYSLEDKIVVYTSSPLQEDVTAVIASTDCNAENKGSVYDNAEKYETLFLIDSSGSMGKFSDKISNFLLECIDIKKDNEYYSIGIFSSENSPDYIVESENNQYTLEKRVDKIKYDVESTYIYDNLVNALDEIRSSNENTYKRIVLITDGYENSERGITIEDVISNIKDIPVPIYTVTLETDSAGNIENLKKIARLARESHAEDIRIGSNDDISNMAKILADAAKNTYEINVFADKTLLDGSLKALEISDGNSVVRGDIRLAMTSNSETIATEAVTASSSETETETEYDQAEMHTSLNIRAIVIILSAIVAAVCIVIAIIFIVKSRKEKKNETSEQPALLSDNDSTMILSSRSGNTEILIGDNISEKNCSIILRDVADSVRTFEAQLSAEGIIIGRSSDYSNIVIDYDKSISRKHCRIFLQNGQVMIEDLNSGNKTYINGAEVSTPMLLSNSDEIKIGRTKLKVTIK